MRKTALAMVWIPCVGLACASPPAERDAARCYRSSESALLGPIVANSRQNGNPPGWIRIGGPSSADSGEVALVDAQGADLLGSWRRTSDDSVSILAADDFLRVELQLELSDTVAMGRALATSDADIERDSAGVFRDFRREWIVRAVSAPCETMTAPATS